MPVRQRCPKCGRQFMGSDCIGLPCFTCEYGITYEEVDRVFNKDLLESLIEIEPWKCPDHPEAELIIEMMASDPGGIIENRTCSVCYKNNFLVY